MSTQFRTTRHVPALSIERMDGSCGHFQSQFVNTPNKSDSAPPPQPKSKESSTVRRELDHIARQLKGLSDRVKRLKETA